MEAKIEILSLIFHWIFPAMVNRLITPREYLFAMFPNAVHKKLFRRQQGFLIPLALFILVVMGVLALTISRTSMQTQTSAIQEFTNIQTFYAAESGAQRGMQRLFFNSNIRRIDVDGRCAGWSQTFNFTSDGLKACRAQVNCTFVVDAANIRSFYTITSVGSCGVDQYRAERTIQVGSYMNEGE
jgi:MSHA biogenesis protein MshP